MIELLLLILIGLWFLNYIHIDGLPTIPNFTLFGINGRPITLFDIFIVVVMSWVVSLLPRPFREIGWVMSILWILSVLGIFSFGGLSSMLVLAVIGGLILYVLGGRETSYVD